MGAAVRKPRPEIYPVAFTPLHGTMLVEAVLQPYQYRRDGAEVSINEAIRQTREGNPPENH